MSCTVNRYWMYTKWDSEYMIYDIIYYIYIYIFSILRLVFNPGYPYKGPFGSFLVGWSDLFANPKRLVVFPEEFRWYQRLRWSMQVGMPKTQYFLGLGGFLQWWYPQNIPKWSFLVGKRMVVGYHHFRKPPGGDNSFFCSCRKLGKMNPFWLLHMFQMGWWKTTTNYIVLHIPISHRIFSQTHLLKF